MTLRLSRLHQFDRLILAGTAEVTAELFGLLPKALRARVVRQIALPVEANQAEVLGETIKIEEEVERDREIDLVERMITAAKKNQKAVLGLDETLVTLQEGRVWQLVYADGLKVAGGKCTNCGALLSKQGEPCIYCAKPLRAVNDLIQLAAERVIDAEGKVEQMRGPAAARLNEFGKIGAILRY
jgi:hypothetical protein